MGEENQPNYTISQENWSLHRKGYDDQQRHQEKVQEAIKNNLPDLVTEESIVMSNGKDVVKIPIRSLDEYKIRYNYDKNIINLDHGIYCFRSLGTLFFIGIQGHT